MTELKEIVVELDRLLKKVGELRSYVKEIAPDSRELTLDYLRQANESIGNILIYLRF